MSGDQRRDRQKLDPRSRPAIQSGRGAAVSSGHPQSGRTQVSGSPVSAEAIRRQAEIEQPSSGYHPVSHDFDAPTHPRSYTVSDSEPPTALRPSESMKLQETQDSINPVRVPARTVHPPPPLWKRAWTTAALVIVIAGGAVGIAASLRGRVFFAGTRATPRDRAPVAVAAAPAHAAPPPAVPVPPVPRATASAIAPSALPPVAVDALPVALPPGLPSIASPPPRSASNVAASPVPNAAPIPASNAVAARPREAQGTAHKSAIAATPWPRQKDEEPAPRATAAPREEAVPHPPPHPPPAPTTSDLPGTKGESEAWITEERRF